MTKSNLINNSDTTLIIKGSQYDENDLVRISILGLNGREFILLKNMIKCEAEGYCTWFYLNDGR